MQHNWIFQLATPIAEPAATQLQSALDRLTAEWKAHGAPVPGQARIVYSRFVIVQAQPGSTSGCSIDSMTRGVESLLTQAGLQHLGPDQIFYRNAQGAIANIDFRNVSAALAQGDMGPETTVFDASLNQTNDLARWEVPLKETWMGRYVK